METYIPSRIFAPIGFKSYYVVWKPIDQDEGFFYDVWFKSYYVVWKHRVRTFKFFENMKFKSYYVVWKLVWLRPPSETRP